MLNKQEQELLDKHLKIHESVLRPLKPIELDLKRMTLRDLETYRETIEFQMLGECQKHLGDVQLYESRRADIDRISKDEKSLLAIKDKLLALIRDESKKADKGKIKESMGNIDNLITFRDNAIQCEIVDEQSKQNTVEWQVDYFFDRIVLVNKEINRKRREEVYLSFTMFIDSLLILLHVKRKPRK